MTFKVDLYIPYDTPNLWGHGKDSKYEQAESWACENCPSYVCKTFIDMSDIDSWTGEYDFWYEYEFGKEEDAVMFKLKWG